MQVANCNSEGVDAALLELSGVGLDIPAWLAALEEEVDMVARPMYERRRDDQVTDAVPLAPLSVEELERQLEAWANRPK